MNVVFLLEEPSMKAFLTGLLPRILPANVTFQLVAHEGKSDLEKSVPRKLRGWKTPDTCFVVVRDQDSGDCQTIKDRLVTSCAEAGRPDSLVRIACRELESWFLGDLATVEQVFGVPGLGKRQEKTKFRSPDKLGNPSRELESLVPGYRKVGGARALGPALALEANRSHSFGVFVSGVRAMAGSP